jgi:hypothetical protein
MNDTRQLIPILGLLATIGGAGYGVAHLHAQQATAVGDFSKAAVAEVRDAQGQVVLSGMFQAEPAGDGDIERKAVLAPVSGDAAGTAEVEVDEASPAQQEIEFTVHKVAPGTALTFVIDGVEVGRATADRRGHAEIELELGSAPAAGR